MEDQDARAQIASIVDEALALFRNQPDYESVSYWEHELVRNISYASGVVQSEKVAPPGGWDILGR